MSATQGSIDSLTFSLPIDILPKLRAFGSITAIKNALMLVNIKEQANKKLLESFKCGDTHYYTYLAKIKSYKTGLEYNLTQHSRAKAITITFKGLHQYNRLSEMIIKDCMAFMTMFYSKIKLSRIDIAIDSSKRPNLKTIAYNIKREAFKYKNTTYFKTTNEKKTNQHLDIKYYHKKTAHITTRRIEFCFKKRYLNGSIDEIKAHCEKVMQKTLGYQVNLDFDLLTKPSKQPHRSIINLITLSASPPIKLINKMALKVINYFKNLFGFKKANSTLTGDYKRIPRVKPNRHKRK